MSDDGFIQFDMLERASSQARYELRQRMIAEAEARGKVESEAEAKRKAIATERTMMNNRRQIKAEYDRAGIKPPFTTEDGWPIVSLSMLIKRGYTIERYGDESVLIPPPEEQPPNRRRTYADEGS